MVQDIEPGTGVVHARCAGDGDGGAAAAATGTAAAADGADQDEGSTTGDGVVRSRLFLVDLGGSERVVKSGAFEKQTKD